MKRHCLALALMAVLTAGCGELMGASDDGFTVDRQARALRLRNSSVAPVYYMAVEREILALINWAPCTGDGCPAVRGRSSLVVPYEEIFGYSPEAREAVVFWWRDPDVIESLVVTF